MAKIINLADRVSQLRDAAMTKDADELRMLIKERIDDMDIDELIELSKIIIGFNQGSAQCQ